MSSILKYIVLWFHILSHFGCTIIMSKHVKVTESLRSHILNLDFILVVLSLLTLSHTCIRVSRSPRFQGQYTTNRSRTVKYQARHL